MATQSIYPSVSTKMMSVALDNITCKSQIGCHAVQDLTIIIVRLLSIINS